VKGGCSVFEIIEPFHVRIPLPFRHKAGKMEVDTVSFDGTTVRVAYHKAAQPLGWWCARATHEFEWLPEVRSPADAARHYADWLVEQHEEKLSGKQREQMRAGAEVVPAGLGQAVYLSADLVGWYIPGGKNWIYVISVGGVRGALRIPDSVYQSYSLDRFEVLDQTPPAPAP
jgi:hypothetical protein